MGFFPPTSISSAKLCCHNDVGAAVLELLRVGHEAEGAGDESGCLLVGRVRAKQSRHPEAFMASVAWRRTKRNCHPTTK